jgi:hypothetical protein
MRGTPVPPAEALHAGRQIETRPAHSAWQAQAAHTRLMTATALKLLQPFVKEVSHKKNLPAITNCADAGTGWCLTDCCR